MFENGGNWTESGFTKIRDALNEEDKRCVIWNLSSFMVLFPS